MKSNIIYRLVGIGLLCLSLSVQYVFADQKGAAKALNDCKNDETKVLQFLKKMPKGGDIHTHLVGAVPMPFYWKLAQSDATWCLDTVSAQIKTTGVSCQKFTDTVHVYRKWSVLNYTGTDQRRKTDHFFNSFSLFDPLAGAYTVDLLREVKRQALENNIQYLEIMAVSPKIEPATLIKYNDYKTILEVRTESTFEQALKDLIKSNDFRSFIENGTVAYIKTIQDIENKSKPSNGNLICRYQGYSNRNNPDLLKVFSQLYISFRACADPQDSLLVGVNLVSEESKDIALKNYKKHMLMFKVLKEHFSDQVSVSLHAGEIVRPILNGVDLSLCYNHIKKAVQLAYADRIGHGIDINQVCDGKLFETDTVWVGGMLKTGGKYRSDTVAIEVNLTSNEFILGVKGLQHCLHFYDRHHIPFVIATDDQGILCTDLTREYVKLVMEHHFDYNKIKKIVYNSIRFSFASDSVKERLMNRLDYEFKTFESQYASL